MKTQLINSSSTPSARSYVYITRCTCVAGILLGFASTGVAQPADAPTEAPPVTPADAPAEAPPTTPAEAQPEPPPADTAGAAQEPPAPTPIEAPVAQPPVEAVPLQPPVEAPPPPPPTPTSDENLKPNTPEFATMDRANGDSFIEITGSFHRYDGDQPDFNFRTELYGQFISANGAGGYASIPFAVVSDNSESVSGIAHLEFGAIYNIVQDVNSQWVLRGGVLTNPSDDSDTFAANLLTSNNRLADFVSVAPDSSWLRLAASRLHRSGKLFLRADGGIDLNIAAPDGADPDSIVRFNVGTGFDTGGATLALEVVTVGTTGDVNGGDRFLTNVAFSIRGGRTSGYDTFLSLVVPLDESFFDLGLLAGLRFPLGG